MPTPSDFAEMLFWKDLGAGRGIFVYPAVFGAAEVSIGGTGAGDVKDGWWLYDTHAQGIAAANAWNGHGVPPLDGRRAR